MPCMDSTWSLIALSLQSLVAWSVTSSLSQDLSFLEDLFFCLLFFDWYTYPLPSKKRPIIFRKSGVHGSTFKWDLGLSLEIPPPILAKLQDGASAISATNCHPSERSYQICLNISAAGPSLSLH